MSFLRGFLTTPTEEETKDGSIATIEKLCDRITSSTLLDDRRDAIRALRALSKSYQVEVGTQAMDLLVSVIMEDSSDVEMTEMVLETLLNLMSSAGDAPDDTDIGVQFTEMFVKQDANVTLLLTLLEEYDFHVRWPTVKLLTLLLKNKSKELQECVLVSPMGVSKLMDLLSDSREIIRNDGLLLLIKLTKSNAAIQKIVAFENAFERLLLIVSEEGNSDGGIIVEDCCTLLINLLRNNISNQNFFRETSNIQRMCPFFEMEPVEDEGQSEVWHEQKQKNILLMLDIVQVLVAPSNTQQSVTSCQKVMYSRGVYMQLMDLMLHPHIPPHIFARLLLTLGDIIRGNPIIQEYMGELEMSDRPAVVLILMFMVNDKQPFTTRMAALYCIQCYLYKNTLGQSSVVTTLLPSLVPRTSLSIPLFTLIPAKLPRIFSPTVTSVIGLVNEDAPTSVTSGQLLCAGLFSADSVAHWLCAVTLGHCLHNNIDQKKNMLHVQLELTPGQPPVLLITQVFNMLVQESSPLTKFGALILLALWLDECPASVNSFLQDPGVVPYLLGQIESGAGSEDPLQSSVCALILGMCLKYNDDSLQQYNRTNLLHLITHRVGTDNYSELLEAAVVSAPFNLASKSAHPTANTQQQLLLDHLFAKFYKKQLDIVVKALEGEVEEEDSNTIESHDLIVNSYKQLIMDQDQEIQQLRAAMAGTQPAQPVTQVSEVQAQPAGPALEHIEQLQQYITQQELYYKQYIEQLQTWYTEQMASEQAKPSVQQTTTATDSLATPDTVTAAQQCTPETSAATQQASPDTAAFGQQTHNISSQQSYETIATSQQTNPPPDSTATSQQTILNTSAAAQQTILNTSASSQQTAPATNTSASAQQASPDMNSSSQQTILEQQTVEQQTVQNTVAVEQQTGVDPSAGGQPKAQDSSSLQAILELQQQVQEMTLLAQEREQYVAVSNDKVQQAGLELKRFNEEIAEYQAQLTAQSEESTRLQQHMSSVITHWQDECGGLQLQLTQSQQDSITLKQQVEQFGQYKEEQGALMLTYQEGIGSLQQVIEQLREDNVALKQGGVSSELVQQSSQEQNAAPSEHHLKLVQCQQELSQCQSSLAQYQQENNTLVQSQQSNEEIIIELRSEVYEQSQTISKQSSSKPKDSSVTKLEQTIKGHSSVIEDLTEVCSELETRCAEFEEESSQLNSKISELTSLNEALQSTNSELQTQLESVKTEPKSEITATSIVEPAVPAQEIPQRLPSGLFFDYSAWFVPVVADDGVTWYTSTTEAGQYYTVDQYNDYVAQSEAYYTELAATLQAQQDAQAAVPAPANTQNIELTTQDISLLTQNSDLTAQVNQLSAQNSELQAQLSDLQSQISELQTLNESAQESESRESSEGKADSDMTDKEKFDSLALEQDDLLILLAHQDKQIISLKARLQDLGEEVKSESDTMSEDFDALSDEVPKACDLDGVGRPLSLEP